MHLTAHYEVACLIASYGNEAVKNGNCGDVDIGWRFVVELMFRWIADMQKPPLGLI